MSSKTTLNQTLQIERGVPKNNSESETTNRERRPPKSSLIQAQQIVRGVIKTTLNQKIQIERCPKNTSLIQTLQIERGVLKNNSYSDTKKRERCP